MTKPFKQGQTWSIRSRAKGQDVYLKGYQTAALASAAERRHLDSLDTRGLPQGLGPTKTTLAQGLQNFGLERLRFHKGAKQEASRINKFLREAGLETLVVEKYVESDAENDADNDADNDDIHLSHGQSESKPKCARTSVAKACLAATGKKKTSTVFWRVTLAPAKKERDIPPGLGQHRLALLTKTADSDRHRLRLACTRVSDVSAAALQAFVDALCDDGLSAATVGLERALLRGFFNHARRSWAWALGDNPATGLSMPVVDNESGRAMTEEEQSRLDEALLECRNQMVAPTLTLLRETAMRTSEPLEHATWGSVNWDACILRLEDSKTGGRDVALSPAALDALRQLGGSPSSPPSEPIVTITYESLKAAWTRACKRAGVTDLRLYDLRHTAATRLALQTGNAFLVQALTGHLTHVSVRRYVKVGAADLVKIMHAKPRASERKLQPQREQPLNQEAIAISAHGPMNDTATPWPVLSPGAFEESAAGLVWPVLLAPTEAEGSPLSWNRPDCGDARSAA